MFALYFLCASVVNCIALPLHFRRITPSQPLRNMRNLHAADTREEFAALVLFQRIEPSQPHCNFVDSANTADLPA